LFAEWIRPVVVLIEDPELHCATPLTPFSAHHDGIGSDRRVGQ
jgi:hypothetical protein